MRRKRGFAVPYAIVMLLLITLMCTLILTSARMTVNSAVSYRNYLESKAELDEIGSAVIDKYYSGEALDGLQYDGYTITDDGNGTVTVSRGNTVMLYMKFTQDGDGYKLSAYIYEPGTVVVEENKE